MFIAANNNKLIDFVNLTGVKSNFNTFLVKVFNSYYK